MLLCFAIIVVFIVYSLVFINKKPKNYPPGPSWIPFLGCYLQIQNIHSSSKYYHLVWAHLQRLYGSVIGLKLGTKKMVIVSGYEAVQQMLLKKDFEGRPDGFCYRLRTLGERLGVVFVEGSFMREQRRFCMYQLRQFGWGTNTMNDVVTKEALEVVNLIMSAHQQGPIKVQQLFDVSTLNTIWTMIAGHRFSLNDKKLRKLVHLVHKGFRLVDMSGGALNQMPFLRFVAPELSGYNSLKAIITEMMDFLKEVVKKHQEFQGNNFINTFLQEVKNNENNKNSTFTENQLLVLLEDFFMAGTETTSNTLSFVIFYLIKYPEVQKKIHIELDKAFERNQVPSMDDRDKLVYLEATIMEVQRISNPVPIGIPRKAMQDAQLLNYTIPKDTFILPSLWSVHMDEDYWKDPYAFRPERFLNQEGKLIQDPHLIPFGLGKRRCIGEILAKTTLFLFISILLHNFKVEHNLGKDFSVEVLDGVTQTLAPFEVKFIPRK
uniref:Cytochrome P450 15A1 n=1 Tax=Maconellicoccus hirsutus TaxID=177089 RepID=A0AAT9UTR8_MACHI